MGIGDRGITQFVGQRGEIGDYALTNHLKGARNLSIKFTTQNCGVYRCTQGKKSLIPN
jgi:hypothetical protein